MTGLLGYELGWMMRLYRSGPVLVSGSVSLGTRNASFINLLDWASALTAGDDAELVQPRTSLVGTGGVHAAWGIDRRFGLLGALTASYGESLDGQGTNSWYSDVRAAVSYDVSQDVKIPLGLAVTGGRSENDVNADTDSGTWFWTVRLALQGRSDHTIGLQLSSSYFDTSGQSESLQVFQTAIDMRYYY